MTDLLIDPDCRDGKCGSCTGGVCEHECHVKIETTSLTYVHPSIGVLAAATLVPSVPPKWRIEAVGLAGQVIDPQEADDLAGARNVLRRVGEATTVFHRQFTEARKGLEAAMRVTAAPRQESVLATSANPTA